MGLKDKNGVPVSTNNLRSLERLERAMELFHGYFGDPIAVIEEALEDDPGFIMGHCFRAGVLTMATEKPALSVVRESVEAVEARWAKANDRERGLIGAARAWLDGDFKRAVAQYGRVAVNYPRDILAIQFAHLGDFLLGQSPMLRDRIAGILPAWDASMAGYGYVQGMYAFGLEETGDYGRAEEMGRLAVAHMPRDPWAIHAVAHVMEMQGRLTDGVDWLTRRTADWAPDNAFAYHNWWHLSLYHLDLGETARVLELYDTAIRPATSAVAMEMVDASALLWRLHLQEIDVGARWNGLADSWKDLSGDGHYAFNDFHAMMAFVAVGRFGDARTLLKSLEERADGWGTNAMMAREVGYPLCHALLAFGEGAYDRAIELIMPVRVSAHRFGGSNAQRDVIGMTLVEAAVRARMPKLSRALAAERTAVKPTSSFNWTMTARALDLLGDKPEADRARGRASMFRASATVSGAAA